MAAEDSFLTRIGVDPRHVLLVLGPQLTAQCLSNSPLGGSNCPPFLSYRALVEDGIQRSLQLEQFLTEKERDHRETLLHSAYELEPCFAAYKVFEALRHHGQLQQWLRELFQCSSSQQVLQHGVLQQLLQLQRQGARLVYTHYDEVLATAMGLTVVLPDEEQLVRSWADGLPSLLHIHGAISNLDSLKLACIGYEAAMGSSPAGRILKEQFQHKTVIVLGMDQPYFDPLLPKLLTTFAVSPSSLPIMVTRQQEQLPPILSSLVLPVQVDMSGDLHKIIETTSLPMARSGPHPAGSNALLLQLVFRDRESSGEIIDLLRAINYSSVQHVAGKRHNMLIELDRPDCAKLWNLLFAHNKIEGLLALVLQEGLTIWVCCEQEEKAMLADVAKPPYLSSLLPFSSTPISMIPSTWAPILSTTAGSSAFSPQTHSAPAENRTAASQPLYQQAMASQRDLLRRIRSENDKLTLEDRTSAASKSLPRKNGLFIHQKSEPQIMVGQTGPHAPIPVPHPAVLMKIDGKQSEFDIEFIDRYQCGSNRHSAAKRGTEPLSTILDKTRSSDKSLSFEDKKQKFISDAIKWSQNVDNQLKKHPSVSGDDDTAVGSVIQTEGREEQRKLLDRHFDQLRTSAARANLSPLSNFPNFTPIAISSSSSAPLQNGIRSPQPSSPSSSASASPTPSSQSVMLGGCGMPILLRSSAASAPVFVPQLPFITPYSMQPLSSPAVQPTVDSSAKPLDQQMTVLPSILPGPLPLQMGVTPDQKQQLYMLPDGTLLSASVSSVENGDRSVLATKRAVSPNAESEYQNYPLKKRRRSTSLPDVMQLANNIPVKTTKSSSSSSSSATISDHADASPSSSPTGLPMSATNEQVFFQHYMNAPAVNPTSILLPAARGLLLAKREPPEEEKEVEEEAPGNVSCLLSPQQDTHLHPAPTGRGPIQLWQFLLDLLLSPTNHHLIHWTGNGYEFQIQRPEDVAQLWGARKNKPRMNYDKLSRGLRYYYSKGIMDKVPGKKLTFKYTCNIEQYIVSRSNQATPTSHSTSILHNNHVAPLLNNHVRTSPEL